MTGHRQDIIQIAGIIDSDEARVLMNCGVDWLGFPLRLPVNKEDLSEEAAAEIIKTVIKAPHKGVLITYLDNAADIIQFMKKLGTDIVQLHGDINISELQKLREHSSDLEVIKSLVIGQKSFDRFQLLRCVTCRCCYTLGIIGYFLCGYPVYRAVFAIPECEFINFLLFFDSLLRLQGGKK